MKRFKTLLYVLFALAIFLPSLSISSPMVYEVSAEEEAKAKLEDGSPIPAENNIIEYESVTSGEEEILAYDSSSDNGQDYFQAEGEIHGILNPEGDLKKSFDEWANDQSENCDQDTGNATDLSEDNSQNLLRTNLPTKPYTLTKNLPSGDEEIIGDFDGFTACINAMDINDLKSIYIITVNRDVVIPPSEDATDRSSNKILLTSAKGGPYTITRQGNKPFIHLNHDAELTVENIVLDGNNESPLTYLNNDHKPEEIAAKLILGTGSVVQHFQTDDYSTIFIDVGELIVKDGATIRDNNIQASKNLIYVGPDGKLTIEGGKFINNSSNYYGGLVCSFGKITINGGSFIGNHSALNGGVVASYGSDDGLIITGGTFQGNTADQYGGAVYATGQVSIQGATFNNNSAERGGAIYINPFDDHDPADVNAYQNLTIDKTTHFSGNTAGKKFTPPSNYAEFTNLAFAENSFTGTGTAYEKSLLNNYDINYQNPKGYVIYNSNGGTFADGSTVKTESYPIGETATIPAAPNRLGYVFEYWEPSQYKTGDTFTVEEDQSFTAKWKKNTDPGTNPENPGEPDLPDQPGEPAQPIAPEITNEPTQTLPGIDWPETREITKLQMPVPLVSNKIMGAAPKQMASFTFQLEALSYEPAAGEHNLDSMPMPDGSSFGLKQISITGEGTASFGLLSYTQPGYYRYRITLLNGSDKNYAYSADEYIFTDNIYFKDGELVCERTITKNGEPVNTTTAYFTNQYLGKGMSQEDIKSLPATGYKDTIELGLAALVLAVLILTHKQS